MRQMRTYIYSKKLSVENKIMPLVMYARAQNMHFRVNELLIEKVFTTWTNESRNYKLCPVQQIHFIY